MGTETLTLFSCKSVSDIKANAGIGWFRLSTRRVAECDQAVVVHNAFDPRKPGDPERHHYPLAVGRVVDALSDPRDGRVLVRLSAVAEVRGARMPGAGRSPVAHLPAGLLDALEIGPWEGMAPISLAKAVQERTAWDASNRRP